MEYQKVHQLLKFLHLVKEQWHTSGNPVSRNEAKNTNS